MFGAIVFHGAQIMSGGNYKYRVQVPTGDELQQIGESLNKLSETLEKKNLNLIKSLLSGRFFCMEKYGVAPYLMFDMQIVWRY
jgi:hypothetical protein